MFASSRMTSLTAAWDGSSSGLPYHRITVCLLHQTVSPMRAGPGQPWSMAVFSVPSTGPGTDGHVDLLEGACSWVKQPVGEEPEALSSTEGSM